MIIIFLQSIIELIPHDSVKNLTSQLLVPNITKMDSLFTQNVNEEPEDIPLSQEPVWILGRKYNALKGLSIHENAQISKQTYSEENGWSDF